MDPVVPAEASPLVLGGGAFLEPTNGLLIGSLAGGRVGGRGRGGGGGGRGKREGIYNNFVAKQIMCQ